MAHENVGFFLLYCTEFYTTLFRANLGNFIREDEKINQLNSTFWIQISGNFSRHDVQSMMETLELSWWYLWSRHILCWINCKIYGVRERRFFALSCQFPHDVSFWANVANYIFVFLSCFYFAVPRDAHERHSYEPLIKYATFTNRLIKLLANLRSPAYLKLYRTSRLKFIASSCKTLMWLATDKAGFIVR